MKGKYFSVEFKQKVLQTMKDEGLSHVEAIERFGISASTLCNWKRGIEAKPVYRKSKFTQEMLVKDVTEFPYSTLRERLARLNVGGQERLLCVFLKRFNIGWVYEDYPPARRKMRKKWIVKEHSK